MVSPLFYYQLVLVALGWLCMMLHLAWSSQAAMSHPKPAAPELSPRSPSAPLNPRPVQA